MPIVTGKAAERFERLRMEAEERANRRTAEEITERRRLQRWYEAIMAKSRINR